MCGIAGIINIKSIIHPSLITEVINEIKHRGPDAEDIYINPSKNLALAHRRLSFLDLTDAGKQPLTNAEQTIWITFNGEIYNYLQLKKELENEYHFKTTTDTEVLIAAYQKWGIAFINKLHGMFAFGLYDAALNKLFLVRDRFGIKPLYYFNNGKEMVFASELKAILKSGMVEKKVNHSAMADYFVYRYIPSPKTIWKDIYKLPSAHYLEIDIQTLSSQAFEYWKLVSDEKKINQATTIKNVGNLLEESVIKHTIADVPIGTFLSGGYDSSALAHYMKKTGQNPKTFSIGFSKWEKSEDQFAKIVANHLNLDNQSIVADESSLDLVDIMPTVYDEPIADISIVPTYMVSKLARQSVKAVLSGEGADEIFGGYTWQHDFKALTTSNWLNTLIGKKKNIDTVAYYANAMAMGWFDKDELQKMFHPNLHKHIPEDVHWFYRKHFKQELTPLKSIQYMDMKCFMGELVLTKVDRASMANSLEVRVPFLDHRLFEYLFSLNESTYYNKTQTKCLLYENIKQHLPKTILERKKQGFVGPDSYYMNIDFYKKELQDSSLVKHQIINQSYIDILLKETYNWKLWKILIMEKWFKHWIDNIN